MQDVPQRESTELAVLKPLTAQMVFVPGGVDDILSKIANEVRAHKPDISTEAGRAAIASLAYKVARSKTALDEMGKGLVTDWKAKAGAVDAERRTIRERLDALKDEVRKPLTDWENADKKRIEEHEAAIVAMVEVADYGQTETAAELRSRLEFLLNYPARDWQEFAAKADEMLKSEIDRMRRLLSAAEKREAERAELERLRAEQIAREQKERDDRIAAEAAERARIAAEAKAQREAEEAAAKAAAEQRRVEQEKADAIARAEKAEADRQAAAVKAEEDKARAAQEAERQRLQAIENERRRVAEEKAVADAATAKREADKKHRAKINNEVLAALVQAGLSETAAKTIIGLIASGNCPHVKISY